MQPKPIDSRRLIDVDAQKRLVDMEGIQHLRSLREHKEHPAETDYDVTHDENGRRNREEFSKKFNRQLQGASTSPEEESSGTPEKKHPEKKPKHVTGQKGSQLDIEA